MSKGKRFQTKYSSEFKIAVIMDMRENHMSYKETARKYWGLARGQEHNYTGRLKRWERIYLEEGAAGLMEERRGRKSTGRPRKQPLEKSVEEDFKAVTNGYITIYGVFCVCSNTIYGIKG